MFISAYLVTSKRADLWTDDNERDFCSVCVNIRSCNTPIFYECTLLYIYLQVFLWAQWPKQIYNNRMHNNNHTINNNHKTAAEKASVYSLVWFGLKWFVCFLLLHACVRSCVCLLAHQFSFGTHSYRWAFLSIWWAQMNLLFHIFFTPLLFRLFGLFFVTPLNRRTHTHTLTIYDFFSALVHNNK